MTDKTIDFYNRNADIFYESTVHADMSEQLVQFMRLLPNGGSVLDAGCGSGRDSFALMKSGFHVEAFDASEEMCRRASKLIGKSVRLCRFEDLDDRDAFDGIWACASLLHVTVEEMPPVIHRLAAALKPEGVLYASFKKGVGERMRGERRFTDADESYLRMILQDEFEILQITESKDVRPERSSETWINVFARVRKSGNRR